ncbi:MAG: radical SAM protein [Candidatus Diapherotrites archaeon]|nr:radical SAM protein [Candidatus Diapherotrites archaeon]
MDVLLINPPYNLKQSMGKLASIVPTTIPMGLAYIAANLLKHGYSVEILDAQVHRVDFNSLREKIRKEKPCIVGLTATTPTINSALHFAALVKKISPVPVVLGGCHPSFMPNEIIVDKNIDIVVRGEAERTVVDLVKAIKNNKSLRNVKGITFKEGKKIVSNKPAEFVENLDELPMPARELLPLDKYRPQLDMAIRMPLREIMTARGCPFNCFFCGARYITGRKYRYNSTERVMREIGLLIEKYGARQLLFLDDNFVVKRERTAEICNAMIERGFNKKILWSCESRVDGVTPELLKLMHKAGCRIISYGIETASQRLLDLMKKDITVEQVRNAVAWAKQAKLQCRATFMLGLPTETRRDSLATIRFAKQLGIDRAKFSLATPYPGTEFYEMARQQLKGRDWAEYNVMSGFTENDVLFVPEGRTAAELQQLQRKAMREFYLRPKIIFKLLAGIRSTRQIRDYLLGAKALLSR